MSPRTSTILFSVNFEEKCMVSSGDKNIVVI